MRQALFVVNPAATGHFGLLRRYCQDAAAHHGWEPRFVAAQAGRHAAELRNQLSGYLASAGDKLVFAVGGDGTVRACAQHLAGTGVALAIVPRGAANLFALALGIPSALEPALLAGFRGGERFVDLAYADGEPFVAMAGIGIDGAVVRSTPHWLKQHLGWLGYAVAALPHLVDAAHVLTVSLDGAEPLAYHAQAVVIGNVGLLPGGFSLLPGALVDDGVLDVGVLEPKNLLGWASIARLAIGAGHSGRDPVEHQRARVIEVRCASELPRQVDGDFLGSSKSLTVRVGRNRLLVRAPQAT